MSNTNYILTSNGNFISEDELYHWGIKGMKWGVRRYQNPDGTLTPAGRRRLEKADIRWAKKKTDKITAQAKKASQKELNAYGNELLKLPGARKSDGRLSAQTVNAYNRKMAELTPAGRRRLEKADIRWAKKKTDKITAQAKKASQKELNAYGNELLKLPGARKSDGRLSAQTVNAYNRKMAELMSQKTSDLRAPSGRVVSFVAKRGEVGVFMALSNSGYDPNQYKQGVYSSGRIAYKKDHANKIDI